ncbi:RNA polymerase sigma factor [Sphingobacterium sp. SGG-5]|uniref:RNA polymerase sigma factor n=1 Tax=Sphingobacterium sp. SGG-5 TaxID=2710881 RepID=UPI0019D0FBB5|nr:sigma-70 family RNA polymerase sigma factor [Sphingobacterium sp. SGG-5]
MQRHIRELTYFAQRIVQKTEIAEEIVQDSFVKVWEARHSFQTADNIKAFLYISTKNACLNYIDSADTRRRTYYNELSEDILHPDTDVLTGIIHAETIGIIYNELEKLPAQQAKVFRLSFFEGFSTEEICRELGISSNAVFLARSRAVQTLQKIFKDKDTLYYIAFLHILFTPLK